MNRPPMHSETNPSTNGKSEMWNQAACTAMDSAKQAGSHFVAEPAQDLLGLLSEYARRKPDVAALWCFGLGLVVGWKMRR